jgi:hypothetical protein
MALPLSSAKPRSTHLFWMYEKANPQKQIAHPIRQPCRTAQYLPPSYRHDRMTARDSRGANGLMGTIAFKGAGWAARRARKIDYQNTSYVIRLWPGRRQLNNCNHCLIPVAHDHRQTPASSSYGALISKDWVENVHGGDLYIGAWRLAGIHVNPAAHWASAGASVRTNAYVNGPHVDAQKVARKQQGHRGHTRHAADAAPAPWCDVRPAAR